MSELDDIQHALRQLHPAGIDLSLHRMQRLLEALGDPQDQLPPVIHVAGTNGKGSVVAFIAAIMRADGRLVHAYVSPAVGGGLTHSIRMAGRDGHAEPIRESRLAGILERVLAANGQQPLTSFEGETAAALTAFAETPADLVLLETGMGGRLDATNVVKRPVATVITPIGLDHTEHLGATLAAIAGEKAGIMRRGVPCVLGRQPDEARDALEQAARRTGSRLIARGSDFDTYEQHGRLIYQDGHDLLDLPLPALKGRHQFDNAGTAIAAVRLLGDLAPAEAAIGRGLTDVRWPGRLERIGQGLLINALPPGSELWLDGAHNPAAAEQLARFMAEQEERQPLPLHLIVGMLASKDPVPFLAPFRGLARTVLAVPVGPAPRAYVAGRPATEIATAAEQNSMTAAVFDSVPQALTVAGKLAAGPVRVLITGSLHLIDAILQLGATR